VATAASPSSAGGRRPAGARGPRASRGAAAADAAYVLHQYDWSESSLIVDLFTRESGRLVIVAKGAKRPYSQLRPVLLPFQRLLASVSRPAPHGPAEPSEVQTLRSAEWAGGPVLPAAAALFAGFYLNELLMRLLPRHDPHPALFDDYAHALARLVGTPGAASATLRAFELVLLREIGLLPELDLETPSQQPVRDGQRYELRPQVGVVECGAGPGAAPAPVAALDGRTLLALDRAAAARDFDTLARACETDAVALKAALQGLLHYHLGTSSLRSRDVLRGLQRLAPVAPSANPALTDEPPTP
jgi:DNA repair protein RecO (recombination protein O)